MDGPGGDPGAGVYHGAGRTKRLRTSPIAPLGSRSREGVVPAGHLVRRAPADLQCPL